MSGRSAGTPGTIRPTAKIARATETALGPARYHDRMPFFGRETDENDVRIDGDTQGVMDREIAAAALAGLNYWAFVGYAKDSPMTNALDLYLSSARRSDIAFCMIGSIANGGTRWGTGPTTRATSSR